MAMAKKEDARKRLLAALFVKAQNHGIDADELREDIAPAVIGKRLSLATAPEIVRLIEHVTKLYQSPSPRPLPQGEALKTNVAHKREQMSSPFMGEAGTPLPREAHCNGEREGAFKRYPPSRAGLVEELTDAARVRWGADFESSLNAFVNSHSTKAITHYKFLDVAALKAVKERIKELNEKE